MIAFVIMQPWTREVLLVDGTWGDVEIYEAQMEVCGCRVTAHRKAAKFLSNGIEVAVFPCELDEDGGDR